MKAWITILIVAGLSSGMAHAKEGRQYTCKYQSGDISVVGLGKSAIEAQANAAEKCFEKRLSLYERTRGNIDRERGELFIDSCVNLECG